MMKATWFELYRHNSDLKWVFERSVSVTMQ